MAGLADSWEAILQKNDELRSLCRKYGRPGESCARKACGIAAEPAAIAQRVVGHGAARLRAAARESEYGGAVSIGDRPRAVCVAAQYFGVCGADRREPRGGESGHRGRYAQRDYVGAED